MRKVVIVGRGLIGGSIELALARLDPRRDVITLDKRDDLSAADGADLIVLSAPISQNVRILGELPSRVGGRAVVTDTGSTKRTTMAAALELPERLRFIGGHPVAGAAAAGLGSARADLFDGQPWILTPTPTTSAEDLASLRVLVESLGAVAHVMNPVEHDWLFAYISHLPQLAVSALMSTVGQVAGTAALALAGSGLRDSTRLAASPPEIWHEIVRSNPDFIGEALEALAAALKSLHEDREGAIERVFSDARHWKRALDETGKSGSTPSGG